MQMGTGQGGQKICVVRLLRDRVTAGIPLSKFQWNLPYLRGCQAGAMSWEKGRVHETPGPSVWCLVRRC